MIFMLMASSAVGKHISPQLKLSLVWPASGVIVLLTAVIVTTHFQSPLVDTRNCWFPCFMMSFIFTSKTLNVITTDRVTVAGDF